MTTAASSTKRTPAIDAAFERAMALQIDGRLDQAEPLYRTILEAQPLHAGANYCLGMLLVQRRRPAEGSPYLLAAVNNEPEVAEYWLGYLEALLLLGEKSMAAEILALARGHGLAGQAADEFARRLEAPDAPAASGSSSAPASPGTSLQRQEEAAMALVNANRFHDALLVARDMTQRFPQGGSGWKILGAMLWATGSERQAIEAMQIAARLLPSDAEAHKNLGAALNKVQRLDDAEHALRRALDIDASYAPAYTNLGHNQQMQGCYGEAAKNLRTAIALQPGATHPNVDSPRSLLLFVLNHDPDVDAQTLFEEHRRVGEHLEQSECGDDPASTASPASTARDRNPDRRLEVGFVSADFRSHSVAYFIEPLLSAWRGDKDLRITVYYTHFAEDGDSRRLRGYMGRWRSVFGLSNQQLAQCIADDGIDILIDLAGHTSLHRLGALARKPAPVQVSWLGYPNTTGLSQVDYYLADKHFLPPGQFDRYFTERLVHLPAAWPFRPVSNAPPVNPLPALASGHLTFGSFNRIAKINAPTLSLWSRLLRAVPASRMLIAGVPLCNQQRRLIEWFAQEDIAGERLTFVPYSTADAHFALHHQVDIALETMPYSGCTTSNHALWMGVPSLTCVGTTPASRLCAANLGQLGLTEFIALNADDFIAKGLRWSNDLPALADLRANLRARWQAAPARDSKFFAAGMELALREMWRRWCAGLPPASFEITAQQAASRAAR